MYGDSELLVDCHSRRHRSVVVAHLGHTVLFFLVRHLPPSNMRFQALVEVDHASNCVGDSEDDEYDCYNRYYAV